MFLVKPVRSLRGAAAFLGHLGNVANVQQSASINTPMGTFKAGDLLMLPGQQVRVGFAKMFLQIDVEGCTSMYIAVADSLQQFSESVYTKVGAEPVMVQIDDIIRALPYMTERDRVRPFLPLVF